MNPDILLGDDERWGSAPLDGVRLLLSWLYPADILSRLTVEQVTQAVANKHAKLQDCAKNKVTRVQQMEAFVASRRESKRARKDGKGTSAGTTQPS